MAIGRRLTEVPARDHAGHAAKAREYLKGASPGAFASLKPDARIALANVHATLALYELLRLANEDSSKPGDLPPHLQRGYSP